MEEKRLTRRFSDLFDQIVPIMDDVKKGFITQNAALVRNNYAKFKELLKERSAFAETIVQEQNKDEEALKYVNLIIPFQSVSSALENLIEKIQIKVDSSILFSDKALKEIDMLFDAMETQLINTKDYTITKNPHLKEKIRKDLDDIKSLIDEFSAVHQNRLITGVCTPKASYLYIDLTDSVKRVAKGLAAFSDLV